MITTGCALAVCHAGCRIVCAMWCNLCYWVYSHVFLCWCYFQRLWCYFCPPVTGARKEINRKISVLEICPSPFWIGASGDIFGFKGGADSHQLNETGQKALLLYHLFYSKWSWHVALKMMWSSWFQIISNLREINKIIEVNLHTHMSLLATSDAGPTGQ